MAAKQGDVAMKARTRLLLPLAAITLLAGCASMDDRTAISPRDGEVHMVNDAEYIAVVENMAARRGVKVEWVNPPKVRTGDD